MERLVIGIHKKRRPINRAMICSEGGSLFCLEVGLGEAVWLCAGNLVAALV